MPFFGRAYKLAGVHGCGGTASHTPSWADGGGGVGGLVTVNAVGPGRLRGRGHPGGKALKPVLGAALTRRGSG